MRGSYSGNTLAFQAKARSSILPTPLQIGLLQVNRFCPCGSVVEHSLGKGEVAGPIPAMGTTVLKCRPLMRGGGKTSWL